MNNYGIKTDVNKRGIGWVIRNVNTCKLSKAIQFSHLSRISFPKLNKPCSSCILKTKKKRIKN